MNKACVAVGHCIFCQGALVQVEGSTGASVKIGALRGVLACERESGAQCGHNVSGRMRLRSPTGGGHAWSLRGPLMPVTAGLSLCMR